jgi:ribokinase
MPTPPIAPTASRRLGETIHGHGFALGPGGKGSNQAVAAARAGGQVHFLTRLGRDAFAEMARAIWADAGVHPAVIEDPDSHTGAAFIFIEEATGNNAIIIAPGAAAKLSPADIDAHADLIGGAAVFVTQLEQPMDAARRGLEMARKGRGARSSTRLPAPLDDAILALCDLITPNETEAEELTGIAVATLEDAERAADALMARGVGAVVITLGERGALYRDAAQTLHVPAMDAGPVAETTGAGDAFNGALAVALAEGMEPTGGAALRHRDRRDFRHAARHRTVDATPGRDRRAAGPQLTEQPSMKRSRINRALLEARETLAAHRFALPDWADWTLADHAAHPEQSRFLAHRQIGWDVTDFGQGRFEERGLTLLCLRNGHQNTPDERPYAEKALFVGEGQETPVSRPQGEAGRHHRARRGQPDDRVHARGQLCRSATGRRGWTAARSIPSPGRSG